MKAYYGVRRGGDRGREGGWKGGEEEKEKQEKDGMSRKKKEKGMKERKKIEKRDCDETSKQIWMEEKETLNIQISFNN